MILLTRLIPVMPKTRLVPRAINCQQVFIRVVEKIVWKKTISVRRVRKIRGIRKIRKNFVIKRDKFYQHLIDQLLFVFVQSSF